MTHPNTTVRCPQCGHLVPDFFHHVAIECEHDMTEQQIEQLIQETEIDSKPPEEPDVPDIITPAMVEAGINALCDSALCDGPESDGDEYDEIATRVYLAMRQAAPGWRLVRSEVQK